MTRVLVAAVLTATFAIPADRGLPARSSPADYPAQAEDRGLIVAAEHMDPDQVRGSFATDLSRYHVFEVAVYPPKNGKPLDLTQLDFALKVDGRTIRPTSASAIAGSNQRRSQARTRDIMLYPNVGVTTGTWGTGTSVGVGVGMGGGAPGPASSDRDRDVMEQEIEDKSLPERIATRPVAGYLFFPATTEKRRDSFALEYNNGEASVRLSVPRRP